MGNTQRPKLERQNIQPIITIESIVIDPIILQIHYNPNIDINNWIPHHLHLRNRKVKYFIHLRSNKLFSKSDKGTIALVHHLYDVLSNTWTYTEDFSPQPFLNLTVKVVHKNYRQLDFGLNGDSHPKTISLSSMADTRCQSCLFGVKSYTELDSEYKALSK